MTQGSVHPNDFGPYIDGEVSDARYGEISAHLDACPDCRREAADWRSLDALVRSGAERIEVPPFQWARIAARLESPAPAGWWPRFRSPGRPWNRALQAGLATLVLGGALITVFQYYRTMETRQLLLAVTRYAEEESLRISADGNPFRLAAASEDNPFARPLAGGGAGR